MMCKLIKIALLLVTLIVTNNAWAFGKVEAATGKVSLIDFDGQVAELLEGGRVKAGETIVTGESGEVLIKTDDDGVFAIRPNSKFVIEAYSAKGNDKDALVAKLIKGGLRAVTGFVGKTAPKRYKVTTATSTIGIRGTDYELHVIEVAQGGLAAGTFSKVNAGEISMTNRGISVNVAAKQYGLSTSSAPPQLLEAAPAGLFKPSVLEEKTQALIKQFAANGSESEALQSQVAEQKRGGGNAESGETRIPMNCAGDNPAQQSLDDFIRAYERGDIAYIQRRLDPNMIGYNVFLNSMMEDATAQKQIRFLIQNRNAQCGSDLAVINFRWEKRFIDLVSFQPRLLTGQASVLTYLKAGEWKLSGITGDNPFASSLSNVAATLGVSPAQTNVSSLPQSCSPSSTSTFTGSATATQPLIALVGSPPPPCTPSTTPNCSIAGFSGFASGTLNCAGTPTITVLYNATGTTTFSSTGPANSSTSVTASIPVSGNSGNGQTASGSLSCTATITYPAGTPVCNVGSTTISTQITLVSPSQARAGMVQIEASASNGDRETLTLNETTPGTFIRTGFNVAGGAVVPNNGVISINGATTITFRHTDPKTGKVTTSMFRVNP